MDYNIIGTAWSLLPPVVAIFLALKTKEVYSSLFIGIIIGAALYSFFHPIQDLKVSSSISPTIP